MAKPLDVMDWYNLFGGHNTRPAGWTLKAFGEMIELCIAAGATPQEMRETFDAEIRKANERSEFGKGFNQEKVGEEIADVLINLIVFCENNEIMGSEEIDKKLPILMAREWEADADGVLRRPERKNT